MVVEQELQKLFVSLLQSDKATIVVGESEILVQITDGGSKITLETLVYRGGGYIPASVRKCISRIPPFSSRFIQTELVVLEKTFEIRLHFSGSTHRLDTATLKLIIEEFVHLAGEWRLLLDEEDHNDRVHIPIR